MLHNVVTTINFKMLQPQNLELRSSEHNFKNNPCFQMYSDVYYM